MSALDRAFIKVYGKGVRLSAAKSAPLPPSEPSVRDDTSHDSTANEQESQSLDDAVAEETVHRLDSGVEDALDHAHQPHQAYPDAGIEEGHSHEVIEHDEPAGELPPAESIPTSAETETAWWSQFIADHVESGLASTYVAPPAYNDPLDSVPKESSAVAQTTASATSPRADAQDLSDTTDVSDPSHASDDERAGSEPMVAVAQSNKSSTQSSAQQETVQPPSSQPTFDPAWEVDALEWPELCSGLLREIPEVFSQCGTTLLSMAAEGKNRFAVTGLSRGSGSTSLAICLTRWAAEMGVLVALVDANFDNPQLGPQLGLNAPCSLHDAVFGKCSLAEAAVTSLEDSVTVIPFRHGKEAETLSLVDPRVAARLTKAAGVFDLVLVDAGPVESVLSQSVAAGEALPVDAVILVCDLRHASAAQIDQMHQRLKAAGADAVLVAENFGTKPNHDAHN